MVEYVYLDQNHLLFLLHFHYQVHHTFAQLHLFEFGSNALEESCDFLYDKPFFTLQLWEVAPLIILRNRSELIIVVEASELLHPLAIDPLSAPNINQLLI